MGKYQHSKHETGDNSILIKLSVRPFCRWGAAYRYAILVLPLDTRRVFIVKDFGKELLKTKSSPIFFSTKLSERKPLFEIAQCVAKDQTLLKTMTFILKYSYYFFLATILE